MPTSCFWIFPGLCKMFYWEMLAKGIWRPLQEAQGGMEREEGCREKYSGAGRGARAIAQARAEALYPYPRPKKLFPFLPPRLTQGLQKAYMKTHGIVPIFSSCCMCARNRLLVLFWLPVRVNEIQWKQLLSKGRTGEKCKGPGDCKKWMASLPCYQQESLHSIAGILPSTMTDQASHIFHLSKQNKKKLLFSLWNPWKLC